MIEIQKENSSNENESKMQEEEQYITIKNNINNSEHMINKKYLPMINLYKNESIFISEECDKFLILIGTSYFTCAIILTNFRLILFPDIPKEYSLLYKEDTFILDLYSIIRVDKIFDPQSPFKCKYKNEIESSDWKTFTLISPIDNPSFYTTLIELTQPTNSNSFILYAQSFKQSSPLNESENQTINGWHIYNPQKEFERQGISQCQQIIQSSLNTNFNLCKTYPEILFIIHTNNITDKDIIECSKYNTYQRFPVLVFYNNKSQGSIWRSSQVKRGITNTRSPTHEKILNAIASISPQTNRKLKIFDPRPYIAAYANKIKGGGFENVDNYTSSSISFCNISNIHQVRLAFTKLKKLLTKQNAQYNINFFTQYQETLWPLYIHRIISTSIEIAHINIKGYSVLIHCSDGWDRTAQLTALSQLIIDYYYRTIEGFIVLIEKEFVSFGHKFKYRNGIFIKGEADKNERSPIFIQWLDCVYQLVTLFPYVFEFNVELLVFIACNLTSCKYGSFISNSHKEIKDGDITENTLSIWSVVMKEKGKYINVLYNEEKNRKFILMEFPVYKVRIWEELYFRYRMIKSSYWEENERCLFQMFQEEKRRDMQRIEMLENKLAHSHKKIGEFFINNDSLND